MGKMQLLAMAICQIETTGIEPVSHDIEYHCSTTELCFILPPVTVNHSNKRVIGVSSTFIERRFVENLL